MLNRKLLNKISHLEDSVQRAIECSGQHGLEKALEHWRLSHSAEDSIDQLMNDSSDDLSPQDHFFQAYRDEDWEAVQDIVAGPAKIELNRNDENGLNALYCVSGCEAGGYTLTFLLEHGADPNLLTSGGYSALARTARRGFCDGMTSLLRFGANLEHRDPGGWTPLLMAVSRRQYEALELLLEKGADIDVVLDDGVGALPLATQHKDTKMISLLLAHEADSITADNYGTTPLHEACYHGLEAEVEKLIQSVRSDLAEYVNSGSPIYGTPLCASAAISSSSILARLLNAGAEIDRFGPGNQFGSALMIACAWGYSEAVKLLLSRGASLEVEGSRFGTAAGTARAFRKEGILRILEEHTSAGRVEEIVGDEKDED